MAQPTTPQPGPGHERRLLCKRRDCGALLARVVGAMLVCLDGTRVGPVERGMVLSRRCAKCGAMNMKWL